VGATWYEDDVPAQRVTPNLTLSSKIRRPSITRVEKRVSLVAPIAKQLEGTTKPTIRPHQPTHEVSVVPSYAFPTAQTTSVPNSCPSVSNAVPQHLSGILTQGSPQELNVVMFKPKLTALSESEANPQSGEGPAVQGLRFPQEEPSSQASMFHVQRVTHALQAEQDSSSSVSQRISRDFEEWPAAPDTVTRQRTLATESAPPAMSIAKPVTQRSSWQTITSPALVREDMEDGNVVAKKVTHNSAMVPNETASPPTADSVLQLTTADSSRSKSSNKTTRPAGCLSADITNEPATTRVVTRSSTSETTAFDRFHYRR
jgi:hypothetical protein